MSKCGCGCCPGPDLRIVTVTEYDQPGALECNYAIVLADTDFVVLGAVEPADAEVVAWLQDASGRRIFGQPLPQTFDLYDWGFYFSDTPPLTAFKLIVQATDARGCRTRAIKRVVCQVAVFAPTVTISYPQNSPPAVSGTLFYTAGWCSDTSATYAANLTRGGSKIADGTLIPQTPGSFYQWQFSFSGVPHSTGANDTTLTVTATPAGGGVPGIDTKTLSIS